MAERQDQDWYPENKKLLIKIGIREITNFSTLLMHLSYASILIRQGHCRLVLVIFAHFLHAHS